MLLGEKLGDRLLVVTGADQRHRRHRGHMTTDRGGLMSTDHNKQTARRLYELLNAGQVAETADLVAADYEEHDPLPGQGTGREGALDRFSMLTTALAPHFTIEDLVAEGDRVVVRWTNAGTHVGDFAGIPATGKTFEISGVDIYRVADGRLREHWHVIDQFSMLGQLGLLPEASDA
jgi:steroid delta-isomerase-like uncharacterized protein